MKPQSSLFFWSSCSMSRKQKASTWQKSSARLKKSRMSGRTLQPFSLPRTSLQSTTRRQAAQAASLLLLNSLSSRNFSIFRKARLSVSRLPQTSNICRFSSRHLPLTSAEASDSTASKTGSRRLMGWQPSLKYWQVTVMFLTRSEVALKPARQELAVSMKMTRMELSEPAWQMELMLSREKTISTAHWSFWASPAVLTSPEVKQQPYWKLQGVKVVTQERMRSTCDLRQLSNCTFLAIIISPSLTLFIRQSVFDNFLSQARVLSIWGIKAAAGPTGERLTLSLMVAQGRMQNITLICNSDLFIICT